MLVEAGFPRRETEKFLDAFKAADEAEKASPGQVDRAKTSALVASARALGEDDEVITATLDLELGDYIKRTIFNFEKHRRIEHYLLITERIGAKVEV